MLIYKLTHPSSDKIYIGKTADLQKRLRKHLYEKSNTRKNNWIKSLRKNNNIPEIALIEEVDNAIWQSREIFWISYYTEKYGADRILNGTPGGDSPPSQIGIRRSDEFRAKLSAAHLGKKETDESRKINSLSKKGKVPKNLKALQAALKGKKKSVEHILKMSQSKLNLWKNPEYRKKVSLAHMGHVPANKGIYDRQTIENIRKEYSDGVTQKKIAEIYGYSQTTVRRIVIGKIN